MSPTFEAANPRFQRDFQQLTLEQRKRFRVAIDQLVEDLKAGRAPRPGLRVKRVQGAPGVWEMTWAPDGRATFQYGRELSPGDPHVIWRRVGTHNVFTQP